MSDRTYDKHSTAAQMTARYWSSYRVASFFASYFVGSLLSLYRLMYCSVRLQNKHIASIQQLLKQPLGNGHAVVLIRLVDALYWKTSMFGKLDVQLLRQ